MKRILVIGANGFTGRHLLSDLSRQPAYRVTGCSLRPDLFPDSVPAYHFIQADIREEETVKRLFEAVRPDCVINTSALSVPDYCETHREEALLTNTIAVGHLARMAETHACRLIHLSTDFVFDGCSSTLYTENEKPNPVNYYGFTKWKGEEEVINNCHNYAIARVAIVYGTPYKGQHGNIVQLVADRLRAGQPIRVVADQWRTPTYVGDVTQGIEALMLHPESGIYHITGPTCLSIADIAYRVADYLQLSPSLIEPITTSAMSEATPRPLFSGLSIEKAKRELNYRPCSIDEGIKRSLDV